MHFFRFASQASRESLELSNDLLDQESDLWRDKNLFLPIYVFCLIRFLIYQYSIESGAVSIYCWWSALWEIVNVLYWVAMRKESILEIAL